MKGFLSESVINKILNKIFFIFEKKKIKSIILLGSAATGELTKILDKNGLFISDLEIIVFHKSFIDYIFQKRKIEFKIETYKVEVLSSHILLVKFLKTPQIYNLKKNGVILWGKNIKNSIWIDDRKNIPHYEGVQLIYNRLIPFEILIWKYKSNLQISRIEEYYNTKLLIAIGEYIMIKSGNFQCSYKNKLMFLEKNFKNNRKILKIQNALKYKLNIDTNFKNLKSIEFTCLLTYNILKKINLNSFKIPLSFKLHNIIRKIINKNFNNLFSDFEIIKIYNKALKFLKLYYKKPDKFLTNGIEIKNLNDKWYNSPQHFILSSYI